MPKAVPKPKKMPKRSNIKRAAWDEFSKYIRIRDAIFTTGTIAEFICISCGTRVQVKGNDAGHFVSGRRDAVLFHEHLVNGQCAKCNRFLEGNYIKYERGMREKYGYKQTEELKLLKWAQKKYSIQDLIEIKDRYRKATKELIRRWEEGEFETQKDSLRNQRV